MNGTRMMNGTRILSLLSVAGVTAALLAASPARADCPPDVGAAVAAACPCEGIAGPNGPEPWRNHGQYVSCVVRFRNDLRRAGCLSAEAKRTIARCAARSTCGKDTVLCCHYDLGTCSDPMPGDMVAAGTCSNQPTVACDVSADCTTSTSRIVSDAGRCAADGDAIVDGGGSVCAACPPPPTTTTTTLP